MRLPTFSVRARHRGLRTISSQMTVKDDVILQLILRGVQLSISGNVSFSLSVTAISPSEHTDVWASVNIEAASSRDVARTTFSSVNIGWTYWP